MNFSPRGYFQISPRRAFLFEDWVGVLHKQIHSVCNPKVWWKTATGFQIYHVSDYPAGKKNIREEATMIYIENLQNEYIIHRTTCSGRIVTDETIEQSVLISCGGYSRCARHWLYAHYSEAVGSNISTRACGGDLDFCEDIPSFK